MFIYICMYIHTSGKRVGPRRVRRAGSFLEEAAWGREKRGWSLGRDGAHDPYLILTPWHHGEQ